MKHLVAELMQMAGTTVKDWVKDEIVYVPEGKKPRINPRAIMMAIHEV